MKTFLVFPHQLFEDTTLLRGKRVLLIEEPLFFTQFTFHIQKLILHRASMKFYECYLQSKDIDLVYCENEKYLQDYKESQIYMYDVVDDWLVKKMQRNFKHITIYKNPNFLNVNDNNRYLHKYYINRRKQMGLFVDENIQPYGGKWSFDAENRKKLPKDQILDQPSSYSNRFIQEAKEYCKRFESFGSCEDFYYPITFDEAKSNFASFLQNRFDKYGDYQDAIVKDASFIYHSNISSSLNSGILNLHYVIEQIKSYEAPFNAKEGFIRQIIGWREFMLSVYKSSHVTLRTKNFFHFSKKIPKKLLQGRSGLAPLDDAMAKLHKTAYNHHIERLMILGNIFLLLEIDPDRVYEFFMAGYIDAYDWVMVGNVYGMSGFSDGGSITTKPYISSSNYIIKMSNDYKKSDDWCKYWDGLYWRFLYKYGHLFASNPRMKMQISLLKKMDKKKLQDHLDNAQEILDFLYE